MIPILGKILLWVAALLGLIQASTCAPHQRKLTAVGLFACTFLAFILLMYSYIISDFSLLNVFQHSHTAKPLLYKITGTWGNHEGSMLLLVVMLTGYHMVFTLLRDNGSSSTAVQLHALIILGFLGFIIATSDPFTTLNPVPAEGLDLNPLLQDIGLAIHPPLLYLGYTGFSILFVLTLESLVQNNLLTWPHHARRWINVCWIFLTLGIIAGSWWAYRELGWGGYWFWDPVENVSLMPWLCATALLHSAIVLERRKLFPQWTALLALLTFILCLIGIFLVRSGILTSVHSFAEDPGRGLYILGFLSLVSGGGLWIFSKCYKRPNTFTPYQTISKETGLLLNNLLLTVFCFTILLGVLYPILLQYFSQQFISVAAPYFNTMLRYTACPLLILAIIVPAIPWGRTSSIVFIKSYIPSSILALIAAYFTKSGYLFPFLGWWLVFSTCHSLFKIPKLSLRSCGMITAHIGLGFLVISLAILTAGEQEKQAMLKQGESLTLAGYTVTLKEMLLYAQDNYLLRQGGFDVSKNQKIIGELRPEVRFYPAREQNTTESAIYRHFLSDIYLVMSDTNGIDAFGVRCYYRPFVNGIWISGILMAIGVLLTLFSRHKKVAA